MSTNAQLEQGAEVKVPADALTEVSATEQGDEVSGGVAPSGTYQFFHDLGYGGATIYNGAVGAGTDFLCWATQDC